MCCKFSAGTSNPEQVLLGLDLEILQYMLDLEEQQRLAVDAEKSPQLLLTGAEREREAELEASNFFGVDIANCTHDQDATSPLLFSL